MDLLANSKVHRVRLVVHNIRTASLSGIAQWYIQLWSSQIDSGKLHAQNAFQLCHSLQSTLEKDEYSHTVRLSTIQSLCEKIYAYLTQHLDFDSLRITGGILEHEHDDDFTGIYFPTAVTAINGLVRCYNFVSITVYQVYMPLLIIALLVRQLI